MSQDAERHAGERERIAQIQERAKDAAYSRLGWAEMYAADVPYLLTVLADRDAEHAKLQEVARPLVAFVRAFDAKPISGLHDALYGIYTGTEWAAEIRLSDLRKFAALLAPEGTK